MILTGVYIEVFGFQIHYSEDYTWVLYEDSALKFNSFKYHNYEKNYINFHIFITTHNDGIICTEQK